MKTPSTTWEERVGADEAERFNGYAEIFAALGRSRTEKLGAGRVLHRKGRAGLRATFEVLPGLPEYATHGLFAAPKVYEARVRLSNGSFNQRSDRNNDIRGFGISVHGVSGESTFGTPASRQDFGLINHAAFTYPTSAEFVGLTQAAAAGLPSLVWYFLRTYGLFAGIRKLREASAVVDKPFSGFATERFWSAAPLRCGPYACRARLLPSSAEVNAAAREDWHVDIRDRLRAGPLVHDFQLQFFVDEATTPIEDASVDWPESDAPYVTVARLTLVQQDLDSEAGQQLAAEVERGTFDPWEALEAHRPLGEVMRARKAVYFRSQQLREAGWRAP